jgi:hypothetical protein
MAIKIRDNIYMDIDSTSPTEENLSLIVSCSLSSASSSVTSALMINYSHLMLDKQITEQSTSGHALKNLTNRLFHYSSTCQLDSLLASYSPGPPYLLMLKEIPYSCSELLHATLLLL